MRHKLPFSFFKIGFLPLQYPQEIMLKYPKVGTANPTVSLWVSDLKAPNQVVPVTPPGDVAEGHLYTAAKWVSEDVLSIIWTNRVQNESRQVQTLDMDGQFFYVLSLFWGINTLAYQCSFARYESEQISSEFSFSKITHKISKILYAVLA